MIKFAEPFNCVWILLPLLVWWLLPAKKSELKGIYFPHYQLLSHKIKQSSLALQQNYFKYLCYSCAWLALIIAAMRPQWIGEPIDIVEHGRDLMLAIDISGSMDERDMTQDQRVNRLDVVKTIAKEFIQKRTNDKFGLILFGSQAFLYSPLSFDHKMIVNMLQNIQIGFAGTYTAIGDAIGLAIKEKTNLQQELILILLSDGANTSGVTSPLEAAKVASQNNIKIYTIGIGSQQLAGMFGGMMRYSDLDEKTLREIATFTHGEYFRATDYNSLQKIYQKINELEPLASDTLNYRPIEDLYYWPLALALFLSTLMMVNLKRVALHGRTI